MNQLQNNEPLPVILIVGKTGSGKSSLGNMLLGRPHDNGPFRTSAGMDAVTGGCQTETVIIEGTRYALVDTPGFFDDQTPTEDLTAEINRYILRCTYGIKAILIVLEATRLSPEQRMTLETVQEFFGNESLRNYAIVVFSKPTRGHMINPDELRRGWNRNFTDFIEILNNRWGISPNSDYFDQNHPIHINCLNRIKRLIARTPGVYNTEEFQEVRRNYESILRQRQEEERLAEANRIENERRVGKIEAEKIHRVRIREIEKNARERERNLIIAAALGIGIVVFIGIMYPGVFAGVATRAFKVASFTTRVVSRFFSKLG